MTKSKDVLQNRGVPVTCSCLLLLLTACTGDSTKRAVVEAPPAYQATPQSTPIRMGVAMAPKLTEVQDAVKRIFKDAAVVDSNYNPNFLAGDFNGDSSEDIAVILKPANVELMNEQYAPWLLRDPRATRSQKTALRIEKDEIVLAVIHGYGANDWRDPEATQTFVLKNVVGKDLRVQAQKDFVSENAGKKLPRPQGDLIGETLQGQSGYLYYASATYSWYDPTSFKAETGSAPMVHRPRVMRAHAQKPVETISADELKTKITANAPLTVIDVRSSQGYAASANTIKGAIHFKLRKLKARLAYAPLKDLPRDREIVTYCACPKDESSIAAAQIFQAAGFQHVKVLQGGWHEWLKASGPVQPK